MVRNSAVTARRHDAADALMERREFLQRAACWAPASRSDRGRQPSLGPSSRTTRRCRSRADTAELSQIEHVVILIQENRSYDHYFGAYRRGRGFADHPPVNPAYSRRPTRPQPRVAGRVLLPWHLDTQTMNAACTDDPRTRGRRSITRGTRGQRPVVIAHSAHYADGRSAHPRSWLLRRADLPLYYALATRSRSATIITRRCSAQRPQPALRSRDDRPDRGGRRPVVTDAPNVNAIPPSTVATNAAQYSWTTMPERLQAQGVSWKCYQPPGALASTAATRRAPRPLPAVFGSQLGAVRNAFLPATHDFAADVEAARCPR